MLVFGLLAVCILVPGFIFWQYQEDQWVAEKRSVIQAVALSRATQIAAWRAERLADASVIARGARLQTLVNSPQNPVGRASASAWLDFVRKAYRYRSIAIIGKDGGRLLSVPAEKDDPAESPRRTSQLSKGESGPVMSDLYDREGDELIAVAATILRQNSGEAVGTVIVEIPAVSHLAPFLSEAVPGSRTVKTLLLTTAVDNVTVLGERPPYSPVITTSAGNRAADVVTGFNKRGAPVLATFRAVGASSWHVAATIEVAEVTGTRSAGAALLLGSVLLSLAIAAAAVRYGWQKDRMRYYRQLYRAEHERAAVAERYRSLTRLANDAILLLDLDLRIVEANDRALEMYGYSVEEITGMDARLLRPEATRPLAEKFFSAVDENGRRYETIHVRKDGTSFFVEGSVRLIRMQSGEFFHTLLRDVTENRQQQHTIERLNWLHRLNTLVGAAVLRSRSREDLFQAVSSISLGDSGIRFAGVFMADGDDIRLMAHAGIPEAAAARLHFRTGDASRTATAMRLGSTQVCSDVTKERSEPFRDVARAIGCRSLASTPLAMGGRIVGALTLGSAEADFFQAPEQQLLEILGADLSYALDSIDREQQRDAAVAALRESEMLFHRVADSVAALIWIDGPDHRYTYVNRPWSSFTGRPLHEHLGAGWTRSVHPDDLPMMRDAYTRAAQQKAALEVEYRLRRHDGVYRWVLDRGCPQFDLSGALTGYIGAAVDITERRERDAALRLSEEHQRVALDVARAGTWEQDTRTKAVKFSSRFKQLYGFSDDERPDLGQLRSRIHADDTARVLQAVGSAGNSGGEYEEEYRVVWPDGSIHWILSRGRAVVDETGAVAKVVGVALDVTARVQTKERLEKAENAVNRIAATAHDAICEIDRGGAIRFATPRLAQLTGYRPSELTGIRAEELIHPEDRTTFVNCIRDARGPGGSCEVRLRGKESEEVWVSVWLSPMDADAGPGDTKLAAIADITQRKRLEEQLMQASKMEAVGQLAGGVAHDFNNLLTVSLGYAQLAAAAIGNTHPAGEHIRQVIAASERGAALTRQLLVFSRNQIFQPKAIDLNKVVADLEKMLGRLIGENIVINSTFCPRLPLVHADRGQIEQVIMNLVVNARDAMPNGGVIEIETASILAIDDSGAAQQRVHLRVRDTGVGMDSATRARIFEPFFTTKPKGRGTGLGLATVYGIVTQASGRIEVTSEPGRGTTFDIYVPVATCAAEVDKLPETCVLPGIETVLVIEDDPALRALVQGALRQAGYTVLLAESGLSGFEVASKYSGNIDLLVTDVMLPGMTGPEIAKVIDGVRPGLPVLLMSGYTGDLDLEDLLATGAEYLQKPFTLGELNAAVRRVLDRRVRKQERQKIIVADDDPAIRELLRLILEEAGYAVSEVENGAELTRRLTSERFDVAITDIVMPEQDGIETLMSLRGAPVDTRVIVLSGGAGVYLQAADRLGAAATLTKPISPARLLKAVEQVLAGPARTAAAAAGK